jgi:hypothetical protein
MNYDATAKLNLIVIHNFVPTFKHIFGIATQAKIISIKWSVDMKNQTIYDCRIMKIRAYAIENRISNMKHIYTISFSGRVPLIMYFGAGGMFCRSLMNCLNNPIYSPMGRLMFS